MSRVPRRSPQPVMVEGATFCRAQLPRRSPRLLKKEAFAIIQNVLEYCGIDPFSVCDNAFNNRAAYDSFLAWSSNTPICKCGYCAQDLYDQEDELLEKLGERVEYTEEQVSLAFHAFNQLASNSIHPIQRLIYNIAQLRLLHGPARVLLKDIDCRVAAVEDCTHLPHELSDIDEELFDLLKTNCKAVKSLVDNYELRQEGDGEGYNIFHRYY
jgi:hypothetical protein